MKGGITEHGEESQGREEEGRQEAVTSPVRKKGGGRRPLFTFMPQYPALATSQLEKPTQKIIHGLHGFHRFSTPDGCVPRARRPVTRRPAPAAKRPVTVRRER